MTFYLDMHMANVCFARKKAGALDLSAINFLIEGFVRWELLPIRHSSKKVM